MSLLDTISHSISTTLHRDVTLQPLNSGSLSGGGGTTTFSATDIRTKQNFFIKSAPAGRRKSDMLKAEYYGVKEIAGTNTVRVPTPICYGESNGPPPTAYVVFEHLEFMVAGQGCEYELGQRVALMHRCGGTNGFGFHVNNTIGATPQVNLPWVRDNDDWAGFWQKYRLDYMLKRCRNVGLKDRDVERLKEKTRELLLEHKVVPSLLHGDLWGGNKGYVTLDEKVTPVIFDPATYYGDREADIAMTHIFDGFGMDFYEGYESEWPLQVGYEKRRTIYNLYHVLNHYVLFGGSYWDQARGMIQQILRY